MKLQDWFERIRRRDVFGAGKQAETREAIQRCAAVLEEYAARVYAEEGEGQSN